MINTRNLLITIAILASGGWYLWSSMLQSAQEAGNGPMAAMPPQPVEVIQMQPESVAISYELPGRVSAYRQSQIRPQVDGIITERMFEEGTDVEKGQQLYQIDDARYKALLNSAKADLASASANVKTVKARAVRYKELVKIKAISQQELDDTNSQLHQANAAVAVAQAAVELAQVNLDYTKVYAPITGRISRSFVTEGALVTTNQAQSLTTITQLDPVYVDLQQSSSDATYLRSRLRREDAISVDLTVNNKAGNDSHHKGTLKFSEVVVDEMTGSVALRALVPNPEGLLLPGQFVKATLNLGQNEVLLVPQRATTRRADGSLIVWVVNDNNQAQIRPIKTKRAYKDRWIVSDGLKPGDTIIVEGYLKVRPDAFVAPSPWKQEEADNTQTLKHQNNKE